ncbi:MAG: regulatory iron-sulfur-containing complex subunit RicT [Bacteroidetes bacterium]|nr:regulatory iron-sulfur-containing complex subunit RicT [Bacteroidota bacterium]
MSCTSCSTATGGKPGGCKSNGGCSTGGCNRMNTYDWLHNLPISDMDSACKVIEVSFSQGTRKDFFRNPTLQPFEKGDIIAVEGISGFDVGQVSLTGEIVRLQMKKRNIKEDNPEMKKVLRIATVRDIEIWKQNKAREPEAVIRSRAIARQLRLDMKISQVEMQADGRKATFFYIADGRVDFRELIKVYASEFRVKVEMRQIGARQEAGKVGGIGSCGRELCCSTWLTDFSSVNTTAARYQNLSINQTKLSGQCGRLKCCLNYELDTYLDALQHFPDHCDVLQVAKGNAFLIKKDIFKNLMWYTLPDSNKQYPLSIERVQKIKALNQQGIRPEELEPVELVSSKPKDEEPEFVELVGQISLRSLDKAADKKRRQKQNPNQARQQGGQQQKQQGQQQGGNRGQQQQGGNLNPQQRQQGPNPQRQQGGQQKQQGGQSGNNQQRPNNPNRNRNPQGGQRPNKPKN